MQLSAAAAVVFLLPLQQDEKGRIFLQFRFIKLLAFSRSTKHLNGPFY